MLTRLQPIKLLLLDVDGVLTDGSLAYTGQQEETKVFNVKDGLGIRMLHQNRIQTGIVTGRASEALLRRCRELDITLVFDNIADKGRVLDPITERTGCRRREIAFIGDDLPDLPLMAKVGLGIAVADAHEAVRRQAAIITRNAGGKGAVREVCEMILEAKGLWQAQLSQWTRDP